MTQLDPITEHILNEAPKLTTNTTIDKTTKIKRATGQMASIEARRRNDPVYKRMVKYRELYYRYREMLHAKYGPRVKNKARR